MLFLSALSRTKSLTLSLSLRLKMSSATFVQVPSIPTKRLSSAGSVIERKLQGNITLIEAALQEDAEEREDFYRTLKLVTNRNQDIIQQVRAGQMEQSQRLLQENTEQLLSLLNVIGKDVVRREAKLSGHIERHCVAEMYLYFFQSGQLLPQSLSLQQQTTDDEYIGAALGWAQEVSRYALQRACEGDENSVEICRRVVTQLQQTMLAFDFRNGPLRRKFDGLKYALRTIEDAAYELSLTHTEDSPPTALFAESTSTETLIPLDEIQAIQRRMEEYDQRRELVIKDSRDIQKLSKQAVFAGIRGQYKDASQKLDQAQKIIDKVSLVVKELPTLRTGSFSNSLEEWAEGAMLLQWCQTQTIPDLAEMKAVQAAEYIGGLSDLTGELGRLAVMLAAKRDLPAVQTLLEVDAIIYAFIARLNNGNRFGKKLEAVQTNMRKKEDLVFELSIMQRSGRVKRIRLNENTNGEGGEKKGGEEET